LREEATGRPSFYALVLLSTAIASYGLLENSTAVVIGAMLIAPLMGPIYGIALGLLRSDHKLLLKSAVSEGIGIALAVGLALVIGMLPLRPEFGSEVLARTRPNLYDLLVAIVAGVAGGYARVSERVSPTLPGVAIATALVPPLAVCGLCLADARWNAALGAFVLFATNLLAIEIAAGVVFVLAGLAERPATDGRSVAALAKRFSVPVLLLVPLGFFLLQTLVALVRDDRLSRDLRTVLNENLQSVVGAEVTEIRHTRRVDDLEVVAVVVTPQGIESSLVAAAEVDLRRRVDPQTRLVVRSLLSRDADRSGQVFLAEPVRQRLQREREQQSFLTALTTGLRKGLQGVPGAELVDAQREQRESQRVRATVRTPVAIGPEQVRSMQRAASESTGSPIQLTVRSVLTTESDGNTYLGQDPDAVFRARVHDALSRLVQESATDRGILHVAVTRGSPSVVVATVTGERPLGRQTVDEWSRALTEEVGEPTRLTIRWVTVRGLTSRDHPQATP
jgi:uncharacterized hydrophobic protein (TIGR00271 family)